MAKKTSAAAARAPRGSAPLNPAALTVAQLVKVLAAAGGKTTVDDVAADLAAGAPTNRDGTLHLVHYAAWLAAQIG